MVREPGPGATTHYRIRVDGHLDVRWSTSFDGMSVTHERDGTSSLSGLVSDQAQLHGLLVKVRDLGLTLLSVAVVGAPDDVEQAPLTSQRRMRLCK